MILYGQYSSKIACEHESLTVRTDVLPLGRVSYERTRQLEQQFGSACSTFEARG
jgi:hypothetical protein